MCLPRHICGNFAGRRTLDSPPRPVLMLQKVAESVAFLDARWNQCRWPLWQNARDPQLVCGSQVVPGKILPRALGAQPTARASCRRRRGSVGRRPDRGPASRETEHRSGRLPAFSPRPEENDGPPHASRRSRGGCERLWAGADTRGFPLTARLVRRRSLRIGCRGAILICKRLLPTCIGKVCIPNVLPSGICVPM